MNQSSFRRKKTPSNTKVSFYENVTFPIHEWFPRSLQLLCWCSRLAMQKNINLIHQLGNRAYYIIWFLMNIKRGHKWHESYFLRKCYVPHSRMVSPFFTVTVLMPSSSHADEHQFGQSTCKWSLLIGFLFTRKTGHCISNTKVTFYENVTFPIHEWFPRSLQLLCWCPRRAMQKNINLIDQLGNRAYYTYAHLWFPPPCFMK